ncbi:serine/threonine-protein kinase [Streptomyces sp. TRM68416]|uniref:serine/threonine-protein kinase n=1 Tax=Streptomyces sp. TRM68416 TaxID=2758412 RepID=UPI001661E31B|nr:serine/threonine-protein kinase [Streptomyces sp. TRM68416]MBD0839221.1 protein kinase [Streptomyces sp. TRM68416]
MAEQRQPMPSSYTAASGDAALGEAGATPLRSTDPGRVGPYVTLGRLGSGGMGRVYLARPADDGPGLAAVKVIRPEYAEDPEFRRRFEREAAVHARVVTPHAPRLLGTGFDDELLWMATEYIPGLNLAEAVKECGRLAPAGVWRLVAELGQTLSALAAAGVVHRDLKPSNVILSAQGVHVIDFGISQAADSSAITGTGSRVGTPAFMSPEYLREGRCDGASDVFSLAGTIVYAATGHSPFGDGTGVDVMHRVAFEDPKPEVMAELAAADHALAALLSACLAKDPGLRPTPRQLIETAAAAGGGHTPAWQEPLAGRLLARRQGYEVLARASAQQTGHFRAPTERVTSPPPGPAFGPPTPPGQYGYGAPVPATDGGSGGGGTKRRKPYLAVAAGVAVCAVAVGAFLFTRPPATEAAASASPTASSGDPADNSRASRLPGTSAAPSKKETEKEQKEEKEKGSAEEPDGGEPDSIPSATATRDSGGGGKKETSPAPTTTVTQTAPAPSTPAWISDCTYYTGTELTDYGDTGQRVVQVQCILTKRGYSVGNAGVDGQFGDATLAAVKQFQTAKGLEVDGQVGPQTWAALRSTT